MVALAINASSARASTTVGFGCLAEDLAEGPTLIIQALGARNRVASDGVVTSWMIQQLPGLSAGTQSLVMARSNGDPLESFTVIGVSQPLANGPGVSFGSTRIPVKAGDYIGLAGNPNPAICTGYDGTLSAVTAPNAATVGYQYLISNGFVFTPSGAAVSASVEPDADADGFGDESQDGCPASAAVQVDCSTLKLGRRHLTPGVSQLKILVSAPFAATARATGSIRIRPAGGGDVQRFVFRSQSTAVGPGKLTTLKLGYPKGLVKLLAGHPSSRRFKMKVTLSGIGPMNIDRSSKTLTVRGAGR